MENAETLGPLFLEIRKALSCSPAELAEATGVSPSYIYQIEGDTQIPSYEYLCVLIKVYALKSREPIEEKGRRVQTLVETTKKMFIEKNRKRVLKKAGRYNQLYDLVS